MDSEREQQRRQLWCDVYKLAVGRKQLWETANEANVAVREFDKSFAEIVASTPASDSYRSICADLVENRSPGGLWPFGFQDECVQRILLLRDLEAKQESSTSS